MSDTIGKERSERAAHGALQAQHRLELRSFSNVSAGLSIYSDSEGGRGTHLLSFSLSLASLATATDLVDKKLVGFFLLPCVCGDYLGGPHLAARTARRKVSHPVLCYLRESYRRRQTVGLFWREPTDEARTAEGERQTHTQSDNGGMWWPLSQYLAESPYCSQSLTVSSPTIQYKVIEHDVSYGSSSSSHAFTGTVAV